MLRFVRRTVSRLLADEDIHVPPDLQELARRSELLAKIRMAAFLRAAVDGHLEELIRFGGRPEDARLDEIFNSASPRPTWKEIGDALGVSAQAAHRKYTRPARPGPLDPAASSSGEAPLDQT